MDLAFPMGSFACAADRFHSMLAALSLVVFGGCLVTTDYLVMAADPLRHIPLLNSYRKGQPLRINSPNSQIHQPLHLDLPHRKGPHLPHLLQNDLNYFHHRLLASLHPLRFPLLLGLQ